MKLKPEIIPSEPNKTIFVMYNEKMVKDRGFTSKDSADVWISRGLSSGKLTWRGEGEERWYFRVMGCSFDCQLVDRRGNPLQ